MNQLATKLLTAENKPANFDTGDRAVLMPQLGIAKSVLR
jgi:RAD51-like protein 2